MYINTHDNSHKLDISDTIRKILFEEFRYCLDEEKSEYLIYNFERLYHENHGLYVNIIGIIFTDFFISMLNYNQCITKEKAPFPMELICYFTSCEEIANMAYENKKFLINMIGESISYFITKYDNKKDFLRNTKGWESYLLKLSPTILMEKIKYCRPLVKEDLVYNYNEYIKKYYLENNETSEIENMAITDLSDFFSDYCFDDPESYNELLLDLVEDYHKYVVYNQISNNNTEQDEILSKINNKSITYINNLLYSNKMFLNKMLKVFIEYHKHDIYKKQEVEEVIKKYKIPSIRKSIIANSKNM
ncbi:MAG TPA: hypothetical protein PKY25_02005 [Bacilli bacterium]|nr:hypothetical protein [Bacilli bacterium]